MGQFISLSSNDGWVQALDKSTWQEARDAATGNDSTRSGQNRYATAFGGYKPWDYNMGRAFFDFVLNQAPGTVIVKAELHLYGYSNGGISACVCQGTQSASLDRPDYDAFTGLLFDSIVSWNASGWNIFDFNALGLAYINSIITGTAKICLREYDHDYLNVSTDALYLGGVYFAEDATFKPFLKLWKGES
jgi:hypothetical protein